MSGTSSARRPRLLVTANGAQIRGVTRAEVTNNGYMHADAFHLTIATGVDPTMGPAWWGDNTDVQIEIQYALLPPDAPEGANAGFHSMLIGVVDHVQFDPAQGTIVLQGRDLSSALIDTKTQETFANKTSSQIATILAGRHGLTPVVTATSTLVGQYYQLEHDRTSLGNFSRQTTEWDLLTYLAQTEGYDLFVSGKELHFQPTAPSTAPPFPIIYQAGPPIVMNVLTLSLERSLTIAKDIQVTVKTWNSKQKNAFTRIVKATGAKSSQTTQNYVFVKPNMTPDEALKFGQQQLIELTKHERLINLTMPGELTLTPRNMLGLTGTGTSWDQAYYVAEIEREISFENGFTQRVRGKNTSPRTQTTVE